MADTNVSEIIRTKAHHILLDFLKKLFEKMFRKSIGEYRVKQLERLHG